MFKRKCIDGSYSIGYAPNGMEKLIDLDWVEPLKLSDVLKPNTIDYSKPITMGDLNNIDKFFRDEYRDCFK